MVVVSLFEKDSFYELKGDSCLLVCLLAWKYLVMSKQLLTDNYLFK